MRFSQTVFQKCIRAVPRYIRIIISSYDYQNIPNYTKKSEISNNK